jgi:wobble nucleotide-excising tRNase
MLADVDAAHGGAVPAAFERAVRVWSERRQFWSRFCDVPDVELDTAAIARAWHAARDAVRGWLVAKQAAPLEPMTMDAATRSTVQAFDEWRARIELLSQKLQTVNAAIRVVKEQAAAGNPAALMADIVRLKAIKATHTPEINSLCNVYLGEKRVKEATDAQRIAARDALDAYRRNVFPSYQTAINLYLGKFGASFRLTNIASATTRAGATCNYSVTIGTVAIPVGASPAGGAPSFRSTLSAGDRNTLALAFFFASLDRDPDLKDKVVVIDDPITSLDQHRHLTTVQEIGRLARQAGQVIVLSCCLTQRHFSARSGRARTKRAARPLKSGAPGPDRH